MTEEPDVAELPGGRTVGMQGLKALAHPLRIRLLDALADHGRATASQLAAELGESSGSTSYHLRQLARHGFIVEDPDGGRGRERYWIPRPGGWDLPVFDFEEPAAKAAIDVVLREQWEAEERRMLRLLAQAPTWPQHWRDVAVRRSAHVILSAEQATAMDAELEAVIQRYKALPADPDARRISIVVAVTPGEPQEQR